MNVFGSVSDLAVARSGFNQIAHCWKSHVAAQIILIAHASLMLAHEMLVLFASMSSEGSDKPVLGQSCYRFRRSHTQSIDVNEDL